MVRGLTHWFAFPQRVRSAANQVFQAGLAIAFVAAVALWVLLIVAFRRRATGRLDLVWFRGWGWMLAGAVLVGGGLMALANSNTAQGLVAIALAPLCAARSLSLLHRRTPP
jgi:hypothetical protein